MFCLNSEIPKDDPTNRFNIGLSFVKAPEPPATDEETVTAETIATTSAVAAVVATAAPIVAPKVKAPAGNTPFYCKLCDVSTTSQHLMDLHNNGAKHAKKIRMQTTFDGAEGGDSKFSANRTPSGLFYCPNCDITVTSEIQLKQHFESKKHVKRAQESKKKAKA